MKSQYIPLAAVVVVLVAGTILEGHFSDRWGRRSSEKLSTFTARLDSVPKKIGDWVGTDDEINQEEFIASNCEGCVSRTYINREGQQVNMYLVSGNARHVTIHTPDWCYVGAGYTKDDEAIQYTITGVEDVPEAPEFLTARFLKEDPMATSHLQIFWTFADDGRWKGPKMPKPAFAGRTALYKMYLITQIDGRVVTADLETNPTQGFVRDVLPTINKVLFQANDDQL